MDFSDSIQTNEANPNKQIFILSGQNNMAGRGGVDKNRHWNGEVPPEGAADSCKIFRFNAHLSWEVAGEPLHHDIDTKKTCGVGAGMSFANAVKDSTGVIGLVPCAVGGTAIKEWPRGGQLYDNMVKRAKAAVHGSGEIKALLWYQGESDTASQHDVDCCKENMEGLIHNVRSDLGLPSLPIIQDSCFAKSICSGTEIAATKFQDVKECALNRRSMSKKVVITVYRLSRNGFWWKSVSERPFCLNFFHSCCCSFAALSCERPYLFYYFACFN